MPRLAVKDGVQPRGLLDILCAIVNVEVPGQPPVVTITACIDGKHAKNSKHYCLSAIDVRSKDFPNAAKGEWLAKMRTELGPDFDVILEAEGAANEHFHAEFDPK